ncbi:MAG: hypothetical protein ACKVIX_01220, partial [Sphingomonadales bacterium]
MGANKTIVGVIFGGMSVEHDVSILSGIQFIESLDQDKYDPLPIYIGVDGLWWTGSALLKRSFYPLTSLKTKTLTQVGIALGSNSIRPHLHVWDTNFIGKPKDPIPLDIIVPAIHGTMGEDGALQGLLEAANIPYTGCGIMASSTTINKDFTKITLRDAGLNVLPHTLVTRPQQGEHLSEDEIKKLVETRMKGIKFPYIVKPRQLGSSVGVSKVENIEDLMAGLLAVFRLDSAALIEPFVPNLVEYNIAVTKAFGDIRLSAIERPITDSDILDFTDKYLANAEGGPKLNSAPSEGMLSLSRDINPTDLSEKDKTFICNSAIKAFELMGLSGCVRIDFLGNSKTKEYWLNEINTIPGSFAYFLWADSVKTATYFELSDALIEEGLRNHEERQR